MNISKEIIQQNPPQKFQDITGNNMADIEDYSRFSCNKTGNKTSLDQCIFCRAQLDPCNSVVNAKTGKVIAYCIRCGRENFLGNWFYSILSPFLKDK